MADVRAKLQVIHAEFGFFGSISVESIYYDPRTKKITFIDWSRNKIAFKHYPSDYAAGLVWLYQHMFKRCDDDMYGCYDKLAIFCCFAHYLKIRDEA